jgi:hypothetical protein
MTDPTEAILAVPVVEYVACCTAYLIVLVCFLYVVVFLAHD